MSGLVHERLRDASSCLRSHLQDSEATLQDANRRMVNVSKILQRQEEHVMALLSQASFRPTATPLRNGELAEVNCHPDATPLKNKDRADAPKHPRPSALEVIRGTCAPGSRSSRLS